MKLPNLRLYDTQATISSVFGVFGVICTLSLAFFVLQPLDTEHMVITYDPESLRKPVVYGATAAAGLAGALAGALGFNSLGQRRNTKQGRSWLGMASGALVVVGALVLFYTWRVLSESAIRELG